MHVSSFVRGFLMEPAESAGGSGSGDAPTLTIGQRLGAALTSKATLQARIADLETQLSAQTSLGETLQKTVNEQTAKIAKLETEAAEVEKTLKAAESEAVTLRAQEQNLEKRAASKAQEQVASLGFPSTKLPAAKADEAPAVNAADREKALEKSMEGKTIAECLALAKAAQAA